MVGVCPLQSNHPASKNKKQALVPYFKDQRARAVAASVGWSWIQLSLRRGTYLGQGRKLCLSPSPTLPAQTALEVKAGPRNHKRSKKNQRDEGSNVS